VQFERDRGKMEIMEIKRSTRRPRILVGVCGSVAAVKVPELVVKLCEFAEVRVVYTKNAWYFHQNSAEIYNMGIYKEYMQLIDTFRIACYLDEDEWAFRKVREDTVLHIQLRKWADLTLIAPLSANTLAKLANGICDNLLTSFARAWDIRKPFVVAPAMNTFMWEHPFTGNQLKVLETLNIKIISPVSKVLACGDTGNGALAEVHTIVNMVRDSLSTVVDDWCEKARGLVPEKAFGKHFLKKTNWQRLHDMVYKHFPDKSKEIISIPMEIGSAYRFVDNTTHPRRQYNIKEDSIREIYDMATLSYVGFIAIISEYYSGGEDLRAEEEYIYIGQGFKTKQPVFDCLARLKTFVHEDRDK